MTYTQLVALVQQNNEILNLILSSGKGINEFDEQDILVPTSWLVVRNGDATEKLEIQKIIDAIISGQNALLNQLIAIGEITIDGNDITIPSGVQWTIGGIPFFTSSDVVFNIPFAATGLTRIDIVVANSEGALIKYNGTETSGIAIRPNIPLNTVLVTQINVTDDSFLFVSPTLFVGEYESLPYLEAANPTPLIGSYGIVTIEGDSTVYFFSEFNGWFTNSGGSGGSTPYNATFIFDESTRTVPAGFTGIITNLNNTNANVTFTVVGTVLTVTGGADSDEKLLINGKY